MRKILFIPAALLLSLTVLLFWAQSAFLDSDNFAKTARQVVQAPAVSEALSEKAVDELWRVADVEDRIADILPDEAEPLSIPASLALRQAATSLSEKVISSERVLDLFQSGVRESHAFALGTLEGDNAALTLREDKIVVQLRPVLLELAGYVGLERTAAGISTSSLQVPVYESKVIGQVQSFHSALGWIKIVLPVLVLALLAVQFWLYRREPWKGFLLLGLTLVLSGVMLMTVSVIFDRFLPTPVDYLQAAIMQELVLVWKGNLQALALQVCALAVLVSLYALPLLPGAKGARVAVRPLLTWLLLLPFLMLPLLLILLPLLSALAMFALFFLLLLFLRLQEPESQQTAAQVWNSIFSKLQEAREKQVPENKESKLK